MYPTKFEVIWLSGSGVLRNRKLPSTQIHIYSIDKAKPIKSESSIRGRILKETKNAKYLGIIIDSKLQWTEQNKSMCKKAHCIIDFLRRNTSKCPSCNQKKNGMKQWPTPSWTITPQFGIPLYKNRIENIQREGK